MCNSNRNHPNLGFDQDENRCAITATDLRMRCIVNMRHGLPRLACNARLTQTQLLDRQGIVRSENRSVYTPLPNCVIHLRASVLDPDLFAVAELSRAPCFVITMKAWDDFHIRRPLQAPKPEHYLNRATRCYSPTLLFSSPNFHISSP
jgi:hypothetical protein